jgi:hypothetical protein
MKFKDICSVTHNKKNNQINLSLKKNKLKEIDMDVEDILSINIFKK